MLKIDVSQIKESVEELEHLIETYEEYSMTIMQEIKNAEFSWHDDHSASFFEKIKVHRQELIKFISDLNKTKESYNTIYNDIIKVISPIKSIYFNQSTKQTILNTYIININNLQSIKQRIYNLNTGFCSYSERNSIRNIAINLDSIIKRLESSKDRVEKMFSKLSSLEQSINGILLRLQVDRMSTLDISEYV